jgi:single-strand DNA-binding protein
MINRAIILGRIGFMETKEVNNNTYTKISVATNEQWKDKEGVKQEKTIWHNVYGFNKLGEIIGKYAKIGDMVYVEGRIAQNKYKDKDGIEKISPSITATEFKILNSSNTEKASQTEPKNGNVKECDQFDDDIPW